MTDSSNDISRFTGERPKAWLFSCKHVGQQIPPGEAATVQESGSPELTRTDHMAHGRRSQSNLKGSTMKTLCILVIALLCSASVHAQHLKKPDRQPISRLLIGERPQLYSMDSGALSYLDLHLGRDSLKDTLTNKYGDLRHDKLEFNKKYPLWTVAAKITAANLFTFAIDRYLLNYEFSRVGFNSWKHNLETGWEWDVDRFGMNFIVHPYSGSAFFNAARSSGYNFWESAPFAVFGSLQWEYFAENTLPAYNDIINTPIDGIFLGEVTYRIGSNILEDQSTGGERFGREFAVFLLSPTRAFSRFTQGKMFRVTSEEVYQTEPLNVTLSAGARVINDELSFLSGRKNVWFDVTLDYGNPFEVRTRKPFDYYRFRLALTKGAGRKILDNVTGYGLLFGKNVQIGGIATLMGGFQHFNYFDNETFELATMAFGPGIVSMLPIESSSNLNTTFTFGIVPLAGNSTRFPVTDTTQYKDYNFGGGAEAKLEATLNLGGWVKITFIGYYFWIRTYVGTAGDHYIGLIKPRVELRLFSNLSLGFEHQVYYSDRYTRDFGEFHKVRTEQKVILSLYFEDFKHQRK